MERPFYDYKIGDDVGYGKITEIFSSGNDYIFYECNYDGCIVYQVEGRPDDWSSELENSLTEIIALVPDPKKRRRFLGRIASAYLTAFHGNTEAATILLEKVQQTILAEFKVRSRLSYLIGSFCLVALSLAGAIFINSIAKQYVPNRFTLIWNIVTFGSLGGFLSISFTFKKLQIDFEENLYIPILTGISRVFIAMISSLIVFVIIKADLLFGFVNNADNLYVFYAFGALSGFSESFIPNVFKRIEKQN